MPPPNDYQLPAGVEAKSLPDGSLWLSDALLNLLVNARSAYDWPAGTGAGESQQTILELEDSIAQLMEGLNEGNAHTIVRKVSEWAGNNANAHNAIVQTTPNDRVTMLNSLRLFSAPDGLRNAIDALSNLPGISLVIASKIFRFSCPAFGASVDRHTSYFFNSLDFVSHVGRRYKALNFRREWTNGRRTASRLATFNSTSFARNREEYITVYLPLLVSIGNTLNAMPAPYHCATTGELRNWRPTDVEMAAYYWGACNGAR